MAQEVIWHDGSVVMASGAVVTGNISLTPGQNLILFKPRNGQHKNDRMKADEEAIRDGSDVIPAHRLKAVFLYDESANINRRYVTLGDKKVFPGVQLYEVVLQGRIDVLRLPKNFYFASDAKDFDYYCSNGGKLLPLHKFHREIYAHLDQASRQTLMAYVKANSLQHGDDANVINIIDYYNKWVRGEETLARY